MLNVHLVYFDAGGGHRSAAIALSEAIRAQQYSWNIRLVSVSELIEENQRRRRVANLLTEDLYNFSLRRGWTRGSAQAIAVSHGVMRMAHPVLVDRMRASWRALRPDLVVSLVPHFNRALSESLEAELPDTPMVTILTDFADTPPYFWLVPQDRDVICGTAIAASQAACAGIPRSRIWRTSGMIVHPKFYRPVELERGLGRTQLGLEPGLPTGLVLFGACGSSRMLEAARSFENHRAPVQLIFICGDNLPLQRELYRMKLSSPVHIEGFTNDLPRFLHLSDFVIGKPGPGCITEALVTGRPIIVEESRHTLLQERYNARWIREQGVGLVISSVAEAARAAEVLLEPQTYSSLRRAIAGLQLRAAFEIPGILDTIVSRSQRLSAEERAATKRPALSA